MLSGRFWLRFLFIAGRSNQGRDRDEWPYPRFQASVCRLGSTKRRPQGTACFAVHAANGWHAHATNGSNVPTGRSRLLHARSHSASTFLHSSPDGTIPCYSSLVGSTSGTVWGLIRTAHVYVACPNVHLSHLFGFNSVEG